MGLKVRTKDGTVVGEVGYWTYFGYWALSYLIATLILGLLGFIYGWYS